jgi:hypothetical protein
MPSTHELPLRIGFGINDTIVEVRCDHTARSGAGTSQIRRTTTRRTTFAVHPVGRSARFARRATIAGSYPEAVTSSTYPAVRYT